MTRIDTFGFSRSPQSLRKIENALFSVWREHVDPLLVDGAGLEYAAAPHRVLFLLKEGNDPDGTFARSRQGDIRRASRWKCTDPYARPTWRPIVRWASYILDRRVVDLRSITQERWTSVLSRIAVVNIKKRPGGSRSHASVIRNVLKDPLYAQFLDQQLSFYRPHVTICGGDVVGECVQELNGWRDHNWERQRCSSTDIIWYKRTPHLGLVICFWHPAFLTDNFDVLREVIDRLDPLPTPTAMSGRA